MASLSIYVKTLACWLENRLDATPYKNAMTLVTRTQLMGASAPSKACAFYSPMVHALYLDSLAQALLAPHFAST